MKTEAALTAPVDAVVRQPMLCWRYVDRTPNTDEVNRWELQFRYLRGHQRTVATVFNNGTWHTWDEDGIGGENSQEPTVERARIEAAASAIAQGFV